MVRFNREKLNGRKVKLFIESLVDDKFLIEDVRALYNEDCLEIYEVNPFAWIDDKAEFHCYKLITPDLPVLLICCSKNELEVKELYKQFSL